MKTTISRLLELRRKVVSMLIPGLLIATVAFADQAEAATGGGMSPLLILFIGFLAAIVLLQALPAIVLFASLVSAVFSRSREKTEAPGVVDQS